jgi:hypothetical protein
MKGLKADASEAIKRADALGKSATKRAEALGKLASKRGAAVAKFISSWDRKANASAGKKAKPAKKIS